MILITDKDLVAYKAEVKLACTCKSTCMTFSPVEDKMLLFACL